MNASARITEKDDRPPGPLLADEVRARPRVAVSSCLLGAAVRFDGGHRRDAFVTELLGRHVDIVPVCPEVAAGMGVPRPALRLVALDDAERLLESRDRVDWTDRMTGTSHTLAGDLAALGLDGAVLKRGSPSCGVARVRVYHPDTGIPVRATGGLFARALDVELPDLPMEDEGRLHDAVLRHRFLTRVFARHRLARVLERTWRARDLIAFHAREKLLLMAHRVETYRQLGRLVARAGIEPASTMAGHYAAAFLGALAAPIRRGGHVVALQHVAGYLRGHVADGVRRDLDLLIRDYHSGRRTYLEPFSVLRHALRSSGLDGRVDHTYLEPYPESLMQEAGALAAL